MPPGAASLEKWAGAKVHVGRALTTSRRGAAGGVLEGVGLLELDLHPAGRELRLRDAVLARVIPRLDLNLRRDLGAIEVVRKAVVDVVDLGERLVRWRCGHKCLAVATRALRCQALHRSRTPLPKKCEADARAPAPP